MDKKFFKFDIDDEILLNGKNKNTSLKKVQNNTKTIIKTDLNDTFLCFKSSKAKQNNNAYEKNLGLSVQRKINPNLCEVEDYINFDFKIRDKKMQESIQNGFAEKFANSLYSLHGDIYKDAEVESVMNRAHIGVIFD